MAFSLNTLHKGLFIFIIFLFHACEKEMVKGKDKVKEADSSELVKPQDTLVVINATFLGNEERNFYGSQAPDSLRLIWKHYLGAGNTIVTQEKGLVTWSGAGWTGQPLWIKEKDKEYIIQGAYDHHLKKIDVQNGELVWQYKFGNVLKGTGTVWLNEKENIPENSVVILQGSRKEMGKSFHSDDIFSFRAVSYYTGKELWRLPVKKGETYSRDVDASPVIVNDKIYLPTENGYLTIIDPQKLKQITINDTVFNTPTILKEIPLYEEGDSKIHGGNLIPEASPVRLGDRIYITSGSGHVYGINTNTDSIEWRFDIGADLNGTPVFTKDSCLLIPIEKQYISGMGGVIKVNPFLDEDNQVEWFFPTEDKGYAEWRGGVVGSISVHQFKDGEEWCAFHSVDGNLYVLDSQTKTTEKVSGPHNKNQYFKPALVYKHQTGASISTPLFVPPNTLVSAGYKGIYLFKFQKNREFQLKDYFKTGFEATPFVRNRKIIIASRDGNLYCFGNQLKDSEKKKEKIKPVIVAEKPVEKISPAKEQSPPIEENPVPVSSNASAEYHVIAGAFAEYQNAQGYLEEMKAKGYKNSILLPPVKGLNYVSIYQTNNFNEAQQQINNLGVSAWIYKKP